MFYGILGPYLCAQFSVRKFGCAKELTFRRFASLFWSQRGRRSSSARWLCSWADTALKPFHLVSSPPIFQSCALLHRAMSILRLFLVRDGFPEVTDAPPSPFWSPSPSPSPGQSYIRHEDFLRPSSFVLLRHAQGTPPGFWNGLDWRALVED